MADHVHLLALLSGLLFVLRGTEGLRCLQCPYLGAGRLIECNRIAQCRSNEACYLDIRVESNNLRYYAGCKFQGECPNLPHSMVGRDASRSLESRDDNMLCTQCCDKDFCNSDLCDKKLDFTGYTTCLSCPHASSPSKCDVLEFCDPAQDCFTEVTFDGFANISYSLGCNRKLLCGSSQPSPSGRKRSLVLCVECCNGRFCNFAGCPPKNSTHT